MPHRDISTAPTRYLPRGSFIRGIRSARPGASDSWRGAALLLCSIALLIGCTPGQSDLLGGAADDDTNADADPTIVLPAYDDSPWGVCAHLPLPDDIALVADLGFKWARISINWHMVEAIEDEYEWEPVDDAVADLRARGVNLMATLYGTPAWASDAGGVNAPPRDPNDWAEFVADVVARYSDDIQHWGLWNEPNGGDQEYWTGTPTEFGRMILVPGAKAAKSADADCYVLGPGVTIHTDWMTWLRECLAGEAADLMDIITVHLYVVGDADDLFFLIDDRAGDLGDQWPLETMLAELNLDDRPCWLEETGWPNFGKHGVDEATQAAHIHDIFWRVGQSDVVEKVFLYELIDDPDADPNDSPEQSALFGLARPDGSPKPAYETVKDFLADPTPPN